MEAPAAQTSSETTTVWEFLFPEVKKETAKASQNVREDLSSFLSSYSKNLDDLYQAIDQNPCRTWGISTAPISLKYPFPTQRTIDEFFDTHDNEVIYPVKTLTSFISYFNDCYTRAEKEFYPKLTLFGETIDDIQSASEVLDNECGIPTGDLEVFMAEFFPTLQNLANFLPEVFSVGQKFLEYILFLYSPENPLFADFFQSTVLYTAFAALGKILRLLYTIESLVAENDALSEGWEHMRRMTFVIKNEPGNYNSNPEDVGLAEQAMAQIHRIVFGGSLLTLFFNSIVHLTLRPSAKHFGMQLERYIEEESSNYGRLQNEGKFSDKENDICDLTLLFHLLSFFNQQPKKRIFSNLWNSYSISPVV